MVPKSIFSVIVLCFLLGVVLVPAVGVSQTSQQNTSGLTTIENQQLYYNPGQITDMLMSKYTISSVAPTNTWEQLQNEYPEVQNIPEPAAQPTPLEVVHTANQATENQQLYYNKDQIMDAVLFKYTQDLTPSRTWEQLQSEYPELQNIPEPAAQPTPLEVVHTANQATENQLYYNKDQVMDMLLFKYTQDLTPSRTWEQLQNEYSLLQNSAEPATQPTPLEVVHTANQAAENQQLYYDLNQIMVMMLLNIPQEYITPTKTWEQLQNEYSLLQNSAEPAAQPTQLEVVHTANQATENQQLYYNPGQITDMLLLRYTLGDRSPTKTWEQLQTEYPELQNTLEPAARPTL